MSATACTSTSTTSRSTSIAAACTASRTSCASARSGAHATQRGHIVQPEVLFPRQLALDVGGLDVRQSPDDGLRAVGQVPAGGRAVPVHAHPLRDVQASRRAEDRTGMGQTQSLIATAVKLVAQAARHPRCAPCARSVADLRAYERDYWRDTGPLARLGLPEASCSRSRSMQAGLRRRAAQFVRRASLTAVNVDRRANACSQRPPDLPQLDTAGSVASRSSSWICPLARTNRDGRSIWSTVAPAADSPTGREDQRLGTAGLLLPRCRPSSGTTPCSASRRSWPICRSPLPSHPPDTAAQQIDVINCHYLAPYFIHLVMAGALTARAGGRVGARRRYRRRIELGTGG